MLWPSVSSLIQLCEQLNIESYSTSQEKEELYIYIYIYTTLYTTLLFHVKLIYIYIVNIYSIQTFKYPLHKHVNDVIKCTSVI